ncbi:ADP-ribosylglycohydrolase family protein [uncultured Parabacteroides sp.]|uniref:ADP-ribosylglycohydrolase family protein n=1 Tax=uncultured Parabacteroides sp. TaxID=512312 RepID=UPI002606CF76|nr:ADP-ribosylglycohydrolase family protein [uncultured Parabacteroides sp.]
MKDERIKDRIRGSLIGGAIGDALGYPVEFISSFSGIQRRYGMRGITRLDTEQWWLEDPYAIGKAVISDDTQMTLFTACGLLNAKKDGEEFLDGIREAYIEWYFTQVDKGEKDFQRCWIRDLPELNARRAPGHTCIMAITDILSGKESNNDSKGCGGVMRIAPIPLLAVTDGSTIGIETVYRLTEHAAGLTHQHPLGYIPAVLVAHLIYRLAKDEHPDKETYKEYIREGLALISGRYSDHADEVAYFVRLIKKAILWSDISTDDVITIEQELGAGWVAEETVAIAVYCTLAYFNNFERAVIAAVNHAGDSDSTGAVTGNILGAALGYNAIPQFYKDDLELHDVILHIADDLCRGETTDFIH